MSVLSAGQERAEAALALQKELMETCDHASRAWLDRVRLEMELWTQLATKLSATRSVPEALEVYQNSVTERMKMAAEDSRRLFEDCQEITKKITRSLSIEPPSAGT
jgi:hypothetical protein